MVQFPAKGITCKLEQLAKPMTALGRKARTPVRGRMSCCAVCAAEGQDSSQGSPHFHLRHLKPATDETMPWPPLCLPRSPTHTALSLPCGEQGKVRPHGTCETVVGQLTPLCSLTWLFPLDKLTG